MSKVTRAALVDAAKDLNKVLDLSPAIDVKLGVAELREQLIEAGDIVQESDSLEDNTREVLESLKDGDTETDESEDDTDAVSDSSKKKTVKAKKAKAAKPAKQKKSGPRSAPAKYEGSFAQRIDNALLKGGTMEEIIEQVKSVGEVPSSVKSVKSAVKLCMNARARSGKYEVDESGGKIKMTKKTVASAPEEEASEAA